MLIHLALVALVSASAAQLGDDDFATRQRAQATLTALAPLSVPALERASHSRDAEVSRAAAVILGEWRERLQAARLARVTAFVRTDLGFSDWPFMDSLPADDPGWDAYHGCRQRAIDEGVSWHNPDWLADRRAMAIHAESLLRGGASEASVKAMLRAMVPIERRRCTANHWQWVGGPDLFDLFRRVKPDF